MIIDIRGYAREKTRIKLDHFAFKRNLNQKLTTAQLL